MTDETGKKPAEERHGTEVEAKPEGAPETVAEAVAEAAEADPVEEALDEQNLALALEEALAERDGLQERLMRALAEAENLRKRAERDVKDAHAYAGSKLARDVLDVYDNLGRALEAASDEMREAAGALVEGVELTRRELLSAFEKHKIERVAPEVGAKFDPKLHQAMFEAPVPGAAAGSVLQVMQEGFTISGRLLRPAMVGVAAAAPGAPAPQAEQGADASAEAAASDDAA